MPASKSERDPRPSGVEPASPAERRDHARPFGPAAGAACGLLAALGYAAANVALKAATDTDAILVSAVKAWPTIAACAPLLIWMAMRKQKVATSWAPLPMLIIGVTVGQLFGNVGFQIALGIVGLALAVPLNLSGMIIGGAVMGRLMLGDPVSRKTVVAILVLIAAACVLSSGGGIALPGGEVSGGLFLGGVIVALVSGFAYAFFGTTMRKGLREGLTVPLAMGISGFVGATLLTPIALATMGPEKIAATTADQWWAMLSAGSFNMAAFFMLSFSLRAIPVVAVNLLNATQAALAALAGVLIFGEPITPSLTLGSILTIVGLVVLGTRWRTKVQRGVIAENHSPSVPDASRRMGKPMIKTGV
jgi:drug/metabolite transporter (DMT)-like permease